MSELRLCKEDFLQYRALEIQEKFYHQQLEELRSKYLMVDTVQNYCWNQVNTKKIENIRQIAYMREKAFIESLILDIVQKRWIIRRTIDMAADNRNIEKSMQMVVALIVIRGETFDRASYLTCMSKSSASRYFSRFFELSEVRKIFEQAVADSKNNFRGLIV